MKEKKSESLIVTNHEAGRDYFILETLEAGIVLGGCEVKSLRDRKASLAGSFARLEGSDAILYNLYIAPYAMGNLANLEPLRQRQLLLHRSQINKLKVKTIEKGLALIPLKMYFSDRGIAKVQIAVAKGKKHFDKRDDIKKRSAERDIARAIKNRNRS